MGKKSKQIRNQQDQRPQSKISIYAGGPVAHEINPRNATGLMELQRDCGKNGIPFKWKIIHGSSVLPDARNIVCKQFLESGYSHLFMVDADIAFSGFDVLRAVATGKDVVGLPCAKRTADFELAVEVMRKFPEIPAKNLAAYIGGVNFMPLDENTKPDLDMTLRVKHIGTGAMIISRESMLKFAKEYPDRYYHNTITGDRLVEYFRFWTNPETKEQWGEDYGFCQDMRGIGIEVHALIDAKTVHYGSFGYECDFSKLASHYVTKEKV